MSAPPLFPYPTPCYPNPSERAFHFSECGLCGLQLHHSGLYITRYPPPLDDNGRRRSIRSPSPFACPDCTHDHAPSSRVYHRCRFADVMMTRTCWACGHTPMRKWASGYCTECWFRHDSSCVNVWIICWDEQLYQPGTWARVKGYRTVVGERPTAKEVFPERCVCEGGCARRIYKDSCSGKRSVIRNSEAKDAVCEGCGAPTEARDEDVETFEQVKERMMMLNPEQDERSVELMVRADVEKERRRIETAKARGKI